MRYIATNPAAELVLPSYENRLAERIVGESEVQRMLETVRVPVQFATDTSIARKFASPILRPLPDLLISYPRP